MHQNSLSPLHLFLPFSSTLHRVGVFSTCLLSNGPDYSIPLSVLASLPFSFKLPLIFTIITFVLNDPFHSAIGVHGALHRLRVSLSLPRLVSLLFLSSSVHVAQPERNQADKWGHTAHTNADKPLNRVQHVTILQGHTCTRVNAD